MRTAICFIYAFVVLLAADVSAAQPRPEHPRPDFRRDDWLNLNGAWQFRFDPKDRGLGENWQVSANGPDSGASGGPGFDRQITVPFCWESPLSGVGQEIGIKNSSDKNIGWYRRKVTVPETFAGKRIWLRFGAVDWDARVWVNGKPLGRHQGGYAPFEFDVSDSARPGEELTIVVRVEDATDPEQVLGKQAATWYTPTSGIWQTVWLEARPALHIHNFRMTPRRIGGVWSLDIEVEVLDTSRKAGEKTAAGRLVRIELSSPEGEFSNRVVRTNIFGGKGRIWTKLEIPAPKTWSPEDPHLYNLDIRLGSEDSQAVDTVHTYFGLRTIERKKYAGSAGELILLNGQPLYLRGALDQSFNPRGICTAPSDRFMERDMQIAWELGCNFLRIHIKAEEPRRLYWADRIGLLLMADMPCTFKHSDRAKANWERTMRATIGRDRNHPAIIAWCLFNESWGLCREDSGRREFKSDKQTQDWVLRMWSLVKGELDPSRLVEDNSPCLGDHVKTDINSWHFYIDDHARAGQAVESMVRGSYPGSSLNYVAGRTQGSEPLVVSEYGAVGARGGDRDISWGFHFLTTQLRRHTLVQGYAYTQLTDVEWEHNGLVNYDRTSKEFGYGAFVSDMRVADLQGADFIGFDAPPVFEVAPQETFSVPVFVSHYSQRRCDPRMRWRIVGTDNLGQAVETEAQERPVVWRAYDVTFQKPLRVTVPTVRPFVGALTLELLDEKGRRLGANYINLIVRPISTKVLPNGETAPITRSPRVEVLGPNRVALRFDPDDFTSFGTQYPAGHWLDRRGKFSGPGNARVAYRISLPVFVREAVPAQLTLMTELATKSDDQRLDWPAVRQSLDCPQTEEKKHPGRVTVSLLDEQLWRLDLPDDPADSRGVLSHQNRFEHGSFGYLVRKKTDLTHRQTMRDKLCHDPSFTVEFRAAPLGSQADGEAAIAGKIATGEIADKAAGISLFGERTGRYPIDPTIIIETARKLSQAPGWTSTEAVTVDRLLDKARQVDVVKTGESGGYEWRFTTTDPGHGWTASHDSESGPADLKWTAGTSGFGQPVKADIRVATPWETPEIWLRAQAELPADPMQIILRYCHCGEAEIFVNGKPLVKLTDPAPGYRDLPLTKEQAGLFTTGKNTIAVHCRKGGGRQALDVGLRCIVAER